MPYSFTEIERTKSRLIYGVVTLLIVFYFASFWFLAFLFYNYNILRALFAGRQASFYIPPVSWTLVILFVSVILGISHYLYTISGLVPRILSVLKAKPLDMQDSQQRLFQNILNEVSVATGGVKVQGRMLPTMALNAFAIDDEDHDPIIGITKGLLYKLNRSQIESVVAHEMAHVVSGDCYMATISSSMFELYSGILHVLKEGLFFGGASQGRYGDVHQSNGGDLDIDAAKGARAGGFVFIFIIVVICFIYIFNGMAYLMRMLVSRQREYRADAIAVRLTRNPKSLAEALYIMGQHRRSVFQAADALEMIFILNPLYENLDESEGFIAELFSTHPPLEKRINILLDIAHETKASLQQAAQSYLREEQERKEEQTRQEQEKQWELFDDPQNKWVGPFTTLDITHLDWVLPTTLMREKGTSDFSSLAQQIPFWSLLRPLRERWERQEDASLWSCPACVGKLEEEVYENERILRCSKCRGVLLKEDQLGAIFTRREKTFDVRIQGMVEALKQESIINNKALHLGVSKRKIACEDCKDKRQTKAQRKLFNKFFPVEVDKCMQCGLTWLDRDELEMLQCLSESYQTDNEKA